MPPAMAEMSEMPPGEEMCAEELCLRGEDLSADIAPAPENSLTAADRNILDLEDGVEKLAVVLSRPTSRQLDVSALSRPLSRQIDGTNSEPLIKQVEEFVQRVPSRPISRQVDEGTQPEPSEPIMKQVDFSCSVPTFPTMDQESAFPNENASSSHPSEIIPERTGSQESHRPSRLRAGSQEVDFSRRRTRFSVMERHGLEPANGEMSTTGVLKRETFMVRQSTFKISPKWNLTGRSELPAILNTPAMKAERDGYAPAPWKYELPTRVVEGKSRRAPAYSFGSGAGNRWGREDSIEKHQPGPGHYGQTNPTLRRTENGRFGRGDRSHAVSKHTLGPGPGSHDVSRDLNSSVGKSKTNVGSRSYSMPGRPTTSELHRKTKSKAMPGPGWYEPKHRETERSAMKPGFGTASREYEGRRAVGIDFKTAISLPGPGTYEPCKAMQMGQSGAKYSVAIRKYYSDVASRNTPGPGSYNGHTTSFGY